MEKQIKKCPVCGSTKLSMERRLDGNTLCMDCGYENKHSMFEISGHKSEKFAQINLENTKKLVNLYRQLAILRNEQLKNVPFSERGTTVELDIHLCKKIDRLRIKLGLLPDDMEVQNADIH